jgi:hypothetical protein
MTGAPTLLLSENRVTCNSEIAFRVVALQKYLNVRFEVFTAVTMKNAVFWDVAPCRTYDVSEECIASIFRAENSTREEPASRCVPNVTSNFKGSKCKAIPVTGCGGPLGCETSRLIHFLDNRLIDGAKAVSLTSRLPFTPQEDRGYSFMLEAESTPWP